MQLLVQAGADALVVNGAGHTASHLASLAGNEELARAILLYGLCEEVKRGDIQRAIRFTEMLGETNIQCESVAYYSPLIVACKAQDEDAVRVLIGQGADPSLSEADGWTPLMFSVIRNHVGIVTLLLKAGAPVSDVSVSGVTPMTLAAAHGTPEVIALLERAEELWALGEAERRKEGEGGKGQVSDGRGKGQVSDGRGGESVSLSLWRGRMQVKSGEGEGEGEGALGGYRWLRTSGVGGEVAGATSAPSFKTWSVWDLFGWLQ